MNENDTSQTRNHKEERERLWNNAGNTESLGRHQRRIRIVESDYFPAPPLSDLPSSLAGNCLIWKWTLNKEGHGRAGRNLAHRLAYLQARGKDVQKSKPNKLNIKHLCKRPYCIQPSHLYREPKSSNENEKTSTYIGSFSGPEPEPELPQEELERTARKMGQFAWYSAITAPEKRYTPTPPLNSATLEEPEVVGADGRPDNPMGETALDEEETLRPFSAVGANERPAAAVSDYGEASPIAESRVLRPATPPPNSNTERRFNGLPTGGPSGVSTYEPTGNGHHLDDALAQAVRRALLRSSSRQPQIPKTIGGSPPRYSVSL